MEEPENINIQLGDIIEIIAPDSPNPIKEEVVASPNNWKSTKLRNM